jgi:hypothetical protein
MEGDAQITAKLGSNPGPIHQCNNVWKTSQDMQKTKAFQYLNQCFMWEDYKINKELKSNVELYLLTQIGKFLKNLIIVKLQKIKIGSSMKY